MKRFAVLLLALLFAAVVHCTDLDGDGFHSESSYGEYQDCCDSVKDGCYDPYLVNPGAWEVPNNGQADRCVQGLDAIPTNIPCDSRMFPDLPPVKYDNAPRGLFEIFAGPNATPPNTERTIAAMDICEFKDDDDDPSWGFARQENMVFSLADSTRNGYDIGIFGPDKVQVSVVSNIGHIEPINGEYMLVMSTGQAWSADLRPQDVGSVTTDNTIVTPENRWFSAVSRAGICNYETLIAATQNNAYDSIMATFAMQQPTNMHAFSFKYRYLDSEPVAVGANQCVADSAETVNFVIVLKNDTVGTPPDGNIAYDQDADMISAGNTRLRFFEICDNNDGLVSAWPDNICPIDDYYLEWTIYNFATDWKSVGTAATPGKPFQLKIFTWDQGDPGRDNMLLLDDYIPIAEARTGRVAWGYQFTSDIGMTHLQADRSGFYPASTTEVTLTWTIKNYGPEPTSDVYVSFTPPLGTSFKSVAGGVGMPDVKPAAAPYEDNSFYRYKAIQDLAVGQTVTGSVTFNVLADAPANLQFRVTATCSSIEKVWGNNHQTRQVYIDKR